MIEMILQVYFDVARPWTLKTRPEGALERLLLFVPADLYSFSSPKVRFYS
jgi:hypothetical protein